MVAIYAAHEGPPAGPAVALPQAYAHRLAHLRQAALARLSHRHDQTRALAVELLNDWEAIFAVLHQTNLPLTNNDAERALRHWVIARRLSHGTRTAAGSRAFTLSQRCPVQLAPRYCKCPLCAVQRGQDATVDRIWILVLPAQEASTAF